MSRQTYLEAVFVEFIPERLEPGKLYVSRKYHTAAHLCCCGCGREVVTPLNPAKWQLTKLKGKVSLYPSIGNWSFPCQSHYWITDGQVDWVGAMSSARIEGVKNRDQNDAELYAQTTARRRSIRQSANIMWGKLIRLLRQWLRL
jgi:hypothetical protein